MLKNVKSMHGRTMVDRMVWFLSTSTLLVLLFIYPTRVSGSCAHACWGHGTCSTNDACDCFYGWVGNDCGERLCPHAVSFVTTRQTDYNFDGDYTDTSMQQMVEAPVNSVNSNSHFGPTASIPFLSKYMTIHTNDVKKIGSDELEIGEFIVMFSRTDDTPQVFQIVSIVTQGEVYEVDREVKKEGGLVDLPLYPFLPTQVHPFGTWEQWPGDYGVKDEAHYMMECSNNGFCDTHTGVCKCFRGYSGHACQRQKCSNYCNERGECKTVNEMAAANPTRLSVTVSAVAGSTDITFDKNNVIPATLKLNGGDRIFVGNSDHLFTTAYHDGVNTLTLTEPFPDTMPRSTPVWQRMEYDMWDGDLLTTCDCDPGYTGFDCTLRKCPKGDDPISYTGDAYDSKSWTDPSLTSPFRHRHERQVLRVQSAKGLATGNVTLRYVDEGMGVTYNTSRIPTRVRLSGVATVNGPHLIFPDLLPAAELSIGDYVRMGTEYRRVVSFLNAGNRQDKYSGVTFDSPWETASGIFTDIGTNMGTVNISTDAYVIAVGGGGIPMSLLAVGDFVKFNSEVRKVSILYTSGNTITSIGIAKERRPLKTMPELAGGVDYFRPFVASATSQSIYRYTTPENSAPKFTVFRITIGDEIRRALLSLPTNPLSYLRVTNRLPGTLLEKCIAATTTSNVITFHNCGTGSAESLPDTTLAPGDLIRINAQVRTVTAVTLSSSAISGVTLDSPVAFAGTSGNILNSSATEAYLVNGFHYLINFNTGANDFDQQGRPGNLQSLVCVDNEIVPSILLSQPVTVTRTSPATVAFGGALLAGITIGVGDKLRIGNDTRYVVSVTSSTTYVMNKAYAVNILSTDSDIFQAGTFAYKIIAQTESSCHATDFPRIKFKDPGTQTVTVSSEDNLIVTHAALVDARDIQVNDRVVIMHGVNEWETRTVYKILSPTSFEVSKPFSSSWTTKSLYNNYEGTTVSKVCSGRGICNEKYGLCECFYGYGGHNCHRFEIDAFSKIEPRLLKEYRKFRDSIVEEDTSCDAPYFSSPTHSGAKETPKRAGSVSGSSTSSDDVVVQDIVVKSGTGKKKVVKVKKKVDPIFDLEKQAHEERDAAFQEAAAEAANLKVEL